MKKLIFSFFLLSLSSETFAQKSLPPREIFVDQLMKKMTLEEKAGQLGQATANMVITGNTKEPKFKTLIKSNQVGSVLNAITVPTIRETQKLALESSRLKIPLIFGLDVIDSYRTAFPLPLGQSASWDLALIQKTAHLLAKEASADGIDWTFAPMVDVSRDPRWGRVAEGAGEDPWLASKIAIARVQGFQGAKLNSNESLLACVKHFAAYGAVLAGRDYNSVDMSDRELFEVYLPPYEAAVKAGAATVMTSFNEIAGMPSTANKWLLTDLLRKKWGFQGFVVTDYSSISELLRHGLAENSLQASQMSLQAGVDLDMESHFFASDLVTLVKQKKISQNELDQAVRRVLLAKYDRGLFHDPFARMKEGRSKELSQSQEYREHARAMARASIVLLKNEKNILPLKKGRIALIGPLADLHFGRNGPEPEEGIHHVTILQGLREGARGRIEIVHAKGANLTQEKMKWPEQSSEALFKEAIQTAKTADLLVLTLGEAETLSGEAASRTKIRIPEDQQTLLKELHKLGKPIVLVLSNGRPLALEMEEPLVDAILETWFLGSQAGHAIADVLFGDYNPSGKLTMTFPVNEGQIPIFYAAKNTGRPLDPRDKYSSKYLDAPNEPMYPFGWGLSYTQFELRDLKVLKPRVRASDKIPIEVTLVNTGDREGAEVVQLYIRDLVSKVTRPLKQLRGFQKVSLQKGESKRLRFELSVEDLKYWDDKMNWSVEPGKFRVMVGSNSRDLIESDFELVK